MKPNQKMQHRERAWESCLDPELRAKHEELKDLTEAELVALIIRNGTRDKNAVELASELLLAGGGTLETLFTLSAEEMHGIRGMGKVKILQMKAVAEIAKRLWEGDKRKKLSFRSPASIADYYRERMRIAAQEMLCVALFDVKGQFMRDKIISKGTLSYVILSPREVFSFAVRHIAGFVVVLHNHPRGNPQPSKEDDEATVRLAQSGKLLEIPLLDHIIIGGRKYYSYREEGLLD